MVMELLVADQPARETSHDPDSKFWNWADKVEVTESRFPTEERWASDTSHPAMSVNLDACIQCSLCVRACREVQVNDVIGMAYRNHDAKIVFDFDDPMGESTCVPPAANAVQACPTGALMPSALLDENQTRSVYPDKKVDLLCPFCGVGCQVTYQVKDEEIVYAEGRDGPANHNRLCVKDASGSTTSIIHIASPSRSSGCRMRRRVRWIRSTRPIRSRTSARHREEALDLAAKGLVKIRDEKGVKALAGIRLGEGVERRSLSVPEAGAHRLWLNNVDHCTRLCHASSVAALMEGLNSGAVSAPLRRRLTLKSLS